MQLNKQTLPKNVKWNSQVVQDISLHYILLTASSDREIKILFLVALFE